MKVYTFVLIIIYGIGQLSFQSFFFIYLTGYSLQCLLMLLYFLKVNNTKLAFTFSFIKTDKFKPIFLYGVYSFLSGGTVMLVQRLDIIMVGKLLSLEYVAYYATAFFFITAILVPTRSITSIATPLLSYHLQNKNTYEVNKIYFSSSLNMLLFSGFIFIGIWSCSNELMNILGEKFGQIKWVILFLGSGKLLEVFFSLNQYVLIYSKYFKWDMVFQLFLLLLTIATNLLFIPLYGINGAAIATTITILINQIVKAWFIYKRFGLHPLNHKSILLILIILIFILSVSFIPVIYSSLISIAIKSIGVTILYFALVFFLKISIDVNKLIRKFSILP